jgi:hypothetical protein
VRKIISLVMILFVLITPISVFASNNASVEIKVVGDVKKEEDIEILVYVRDVDKLYAASVDFTYNNDQLKVYKIESTSYIKDNKDNVLELGGEVDKGGNTATYSFTFLGDLDGLSNSGTLVKIRAKVLNDDKLVITKDNMKIKLIQRVGDSTKNYEYAFVGYDENLNNTPSNDRENDDKFESSQNSTIDNSNNNSNNINSSDNAEDILKEEDKATNSVTSVNNETNKNVDSKDDEDNDTYDNKVKSKTLGGSSASILYIVGILLVCLIFLVYYYKVKRPNGNKS